MFEEISKRFKLSLKGVPTVGDSLRDLQAGFISGCVPYLVLTGKGEKTHETGGLPPGTQVFPDLAIHGDMPSSRTPPVRPPATVASPA
jgi:D-glycero-D-manno-heptose 1,7-bisphosphate phosphatase